jgi:glyoxylase-like metal-dependent hydrolase (beta-lactamase superfamily II)
MISVPWHFTVGSFRCIAIRDGGHLGSADFLFCNAPKEEVAQALQKHGLEADQLKSSWTCLLVDTGEKTLLIDTGIGSGVSEGGQLVSQLAQEGYSAESMDLVFLTHGHPDHIGGCTDENGKPTFPQARYLMGRTEYAFWTSEENLSKLSEGMRRFAQKNLPAIQERVQLVEDGEEILPGIQVLETFGHTPGHMGLEIQSQGEVFLHLADSALHELHVEHPDWFAPVDMQPEQMVATRYKCLERAASNGAKVLFYHFDFPGMGYVLKDEGTWRWKSIREAS